MRLRRFQLQDMAVQPRRFQRSERGRRRLQPHERSAAGHRAAAGPRPRALARGPGPRAPPGVRRPAAAVQRRLPGRGEHPGVAGAHVRPATTSRRGAQLVADNPFAGDPRAGLLPPVRERLQPRQPRQRRLDPLRSSGSSATSRSSGAGCSIRRPPRSGKRVLVIGAGPERALGRLPPGAARPRGRDPRRGRASRAG